MKNERKMSDEEFFDDCDICALMKDKQKEGSAPSTSELLTAFSFANARQEKRSTNKQPMPKKEQKVQIELTTAQYKILIDSIGVASSIYGVMGDMVDEKYKTQSSALEDLEQHVLEKAADLGLSSLVHVFGGKKHIDDDHMDLLMDDILEYDEFNFWDTLPEKLAERDLRELHGPKKLNKLDPLEFIDLEYPIEMKYREEFEEHDVDRLRISDESRPNSKT